MKLDRNINGNGRGKYALLLLRQIDNFIRPDDPFQRVNQRIVDALRTLEDAGIIDWGLQGTESEFMVFRLKDRYAAEALEAYANEAGRFDPEYADEIREMADRAGPKSPWCKTSD